MICGSCGRRMKLGRFRVSIHGMAAIKGYAYPKVAWYDGDELVCESEKDETKGDLRREVLMRELETSLKELGTDYVDLYWLHKDDPNHPIEDVIETCNEMLRQGKVRRIGASNFADERIEQGNRYAREHGLTGFQESQIQWSAARSNEEIFSRFGSVVMTPQRYRFYRCSRSAPRHRAFTQGWTRSDWMRFRRA